MGLSENVALLTSLIYHHLPNEHDLQTHIVKILGTQKTALFHDPDHRPMTAL
jgi:hypothetical protein